MRASGPLLSLLAVACTCAPPVPPSRETPALGPLEHPDDLRGEALHLAAVDARRAFAVTRDEVGGMARVALVEDGAPRWQRTVPCDASHLGWIGVTGDAALFTIRCAARGALFTFALSTRDGALAWTAGPAWGEDAVQRFRGNRSLQLGDVLVEHAHAVGIVAYERASGRELFARATDALAVRALGEHVALHAGGIEALDPRSGRPVHTDDELLGAIPGGACARSDAGIERVRADGSRELLIAREALAGLPLARGPGVPTRCGLRAGRTVLFVDLPFSVSAIVAERDRVVHELRLPQTSGAPAIAGWDRELPRFVPLLTRGDDLHVVDLDEGVVRSARHLPARAETRVYGEIVALRARVGDRFLISYDARLVALDGATGELSADDSALRNDGWWLDLEDAVYGDGVFVPRDDDGRLVVAPAALRGDAELLARLLPVGGE